jgi:D-glycero-D-manno-heptose 1,7-bisphosphate phosphatase
MNRAIFLDRDGVINRLIFNPQTGEYESPHYVKDFALYPWTLKSLLKLKRMGYLLFLVSNQPSFAKGKTSLENIMVIHNKLHELLVKNHIHFAEYFYCYHHPNGIVPEFAVECTCRKPGTLFLSIASEKYNFSIENSWFIGDKNTDVLCGHFFGLKTILIDEERFANKQGQSLPNYYAQNLENAIKIIETTMDNGSKGKDDEN